MSGYNYPSSSILAHISVVVELQRRLDEALSEIKHIIHELPQGEVRGIMSWQREEAALANQKSKSYTRMLSETAKRNLKPVEE